MERPQAQETSRGPYRRSPVPPAQETTLQWGMMVCPCPRNQRRERSCCHLGWNGRNPSEKRREEMCSSLRPMNWTASVATGKMKTSWIIDFHFLILWAVIWFEEAYVVQIIILQTLSRRNDSRVCYYHCNNVRVWNKNTSNKCGQNLPLINYPGRSSSALWKLVYLFHKVTYLREELQCGSRRMSQSDCFPPGTKSCGIDLWLS